MMQYMCEGRNIDTQDMLRDQVDNAVTFDIVASSVELLHVMIEGISNRTLPLLIQVWDWMFNMNSDYCFSLVHIWFHIDWKLRSH